MSESAERLSPLDKEARAVRVLNDDQTATFDREYMYDKRWQLVKACLDRDFPDGRFSFVDIGGGNGLFADRVLREYPESTAAVLDLSEPLLARNAPDPRKRVICGSATELRALNEKFDVVFFNWVLHHLVSDTYHDSLANIRSTLRQCAGVLSPRGRVSVFENLYDGLWLDGIPGRMVFAATSLRRLAPLVRAAGANTAGCGVCFQSEAQWRDHFKLSGLKVQTFARDSKFRISTLRRWAIHARAIGPAHFWLTRA